MFTYLDMLRRMQGDALDLLGLGPAACNHRTIASGSRWRLRGYAKADSAPPLLIVAAPIKRPYIWDLAPWVSAIRRCLEGRLSVFLLEWVPPKPGHPNGGLEEYAGQAIGEAVAACSREADGARPVLIGHSLGGTLAAIFAAMQPSTISGLVLLSSALLRAGLQPLSGCAGRDRSIRGLDGHYPGHVLVAAQRHRIARHLRLVEAC